VFGVTFVMYAKDDMAREEALRYWRETHGPLVAKVPGVRRYVQQQAVGCPEGEPPFLGVATIYFDDQEAWVTASGSGEFGAAVADVGNFADTAIAPAFTEDVTIVG
jgi:uncharacterized protein (TIGR02118 family)